MGQQQREDRSTTRRGVRRRRVPAAAILLIVLLAAGLAVAGWYWLSVVRKPIEPDSGPVADALPPVEEPADEPDENVPSIPAETLVFEPDLWASAHFAIWQGEPASDLLLFTVPVGTKLFAPFDCYVSRGVGDLLGDYSVDAIDLASAKADDPWPSKDDGVYRLSLRATDIELSETAASGKLVKKGELLGVVTTANSFPSPFDDANFLLQFIPWWPQKLAEPPTDPTKFFEALLALIPGQ